MKTTVEISGPLLDEAKKLAAARKTTLRALLEEGLRFALKRHRRRNTFRLRKASVRGKGMKLPFREDRWDAVRDAAYEGRGT